jgi:hypothetical protein
MKHARPRGLNLRRVERLLSETKHAGSTAGRIETLSRRLVGHPYQSNPLIGSADSPEVFTASLEGFDCVTYIETILALALASSADDFIEELRMIRYEKGRIEWRWRNHYMTSWIRNNLHEGVIRPVSVRAVPIVSRERVLDVLPGLGPQRIRVKCVPKPAVARLARYLKGGDLIFFVSTRKHLDVFHAGIIADDGKNPRMRHASRSREGVVEEDLGVFLRANRMTGVIAVRPQEPADA